MPTEGREETTEPERYPNLHAVPTKRLATNIVGSIILAKGNVNMWGALIEKFLTDYRDEEKTLADLARRLAKRHKTLLPDHHAIGACKCRDHKLTHEARKAGLLEGGDRG